MSFPASLVPPWCLAGCPINPFLPPWCRPGCPLGPFLPPWCLPGAWQAVQLVLSCLPGAVHLVLSCLPGASQAVQLVFSCLPGASLVLPQLPPGMSPWLSRASRAVRSLEPPRQSKRLFCCLMGCPRRYLEPPKHSRWLSGASRAAQIALGETPCTGFRGPNPLVPAVSGAKTLDQAMKTTRFRGGKPCKPQSR